MVQMGFLWVVDSYGYATSRLSDHDAIPRLSKVFVAVLKKIIGHVASRIRWEYSRVSSGGHITLKWSARR